ncbi:hypothetical protein FZEAL_1387 [Fusarium zealandicum]|uniref:Uncharacterized protein n=1 Tax=Fusarium zealandicum TaxID=1053134 RepID=A0A8H4UTJ6_9HYPO|nr:hypothetical protein FZEAL_1387 [Fusarium zealandicum]
MFKFRIKGGKLDKSLRKDEVATMARVSARRKPEGVGTDLRKHGRLLNPAKLERYLRDHPSLIPSLRRHAIAYLEFKHQIESLLPRHIVALESPAPLPFDETLYNIERMPVLMKGYYDTMKSEKNIEES